MVFKKKEVVDNDSDSIESLFIPSTQLQRVPGNKLGVYAAPGVGKTHLACTAKKPIYFIDTENSARMITKNFDPAEAEQIRILEVLKFVERKGTEEKIDYGKSLQATMVAINKLMDLIETTPEGEEGTIVIDSATDIWEWLKQWLMEQKDLKYTASGFMMQTEWAKPNKRWADFLVTLKSCRWHVVLTFKSRAEYDGKGAKTGTNTAIWQGQTEFVWNNVGELLSDGNGGNRFILRKTRDGKQANPNVDILDNPKWMDIINMLEKRSGLTYV